MTITPEQLKLTKNNFNGMISRLGLIAETEALDKNGTIQLEITTRDPGRLIGRNGQYLNALQHLLNTMLLTHDGSFPRVQIDVAGYQGGKREKRNGNSSSPSSKLRQQAIEAAKEVKKWGEDVKLAPLGEKDREAVKQILKDDSEIEVIAIDGDQDQQKQRIAIRLKK